MTTDKSNLYLTNLKHLWPVLIESELNPGGMAGMLMEMSAVIEVDDKKGLVVLSVDPVAKGMACQVVLDRVARYLAETFNRNIALRVI